MSTLGASAARVADMLARADLEAQIRAEIVLAIKHYERQPWAFTEHLDATVTTVAGDPYYTALDVTAGEGLPARPAAVTIDRLTAVDMVILGDDRLDPMRFSEIRDLIAGPASGGEPEWWCLYAGRLMLYPIPNAAYAVKVSGRVKPPVPAADEDASIWLSRAQELIEARAAGMTAAKFTQDVERAQMFAAVEAQQLQSLLAESCREQATGRIRPHD